MRSSNHLLARLLAGAAALVAAGAVTLAPSTAHAAAATDGSLLPSLPSLPALPVPTSVPQLPSLAVPPAPALPAPLSSLAGVPQSLATGLAGTGGGGPLAPSTPAATASTTAASTAPTATSSTTTSAAATSPRRSTAASGPGITIGGGLAGAGHGCLSAGSANGGGLVVMGQDVLGQLTKALPQTADFVVPCTTENGLAVDADLVAATLCLRLDPPAASPLRATVELAGTDVLQQLEAAGLPLQQVLTPCGATPTTSASGTPTGAGGTPTSEPTATSGPTTPTDVQAGAAADTAARLPFTGAEVAPTVLLALGLVLLGIGLLRGRGPHETGT
jgi:hypothetical protein